MKKQEAIEKAYGEHWNDVKTYVDENGFCNQRKDIGFYEISQTMDIDMPGYHWRPTSLRGIENNNGWIICDADNSEFQPDWYWVKKKDGDEEIVFYAPHRECFGAVDGDIYISDITHYQPIEKPLKPIY